MALISCQFESNSDNSSHTENNIDSNAVANNSDTTQDTTEEYVSGYRAEAVKNEDEGWGYVIYNGDKPYINQPHIPAVSGVKPFKNEEDALKTGQFAIYKIEQGILPPTLTKEELDSLGVLY